MQLQSVLSTLAGIVEWLYTTYLGRAVIAFAVLIVGWYCSRMAVRMLGRPLAQRFERQSLTRTILRVVRISIMLVAIVVAAGIMGIGGGNIILSVTVLSAAVGVILAPIVGNILSGLFVLADQPYEIGDMIEIADTQQRGFIEDITLRYTKIRTQENTMLVIPNSTIRERDVVNYSAEDERTWMQLDLTVTYEGDLAEARRIMVRAARNTDGVIGGGPTIRIGNTRYPSRPVCQIREYADHGVRLRLMYWIQNPYYTGKIRSEIQERIWKELDDADVEIPYPHTHLVFDETSGTARVAPEDGRPPDADGIEPDLTGRQ